MGRPRRGRIDIPLATSKVIFFVGYYGFGNIGDEAILAAALEQFRGRRADLRLIVASGNPVATAAAHGVEAIPWNDMAAIHAAVQAADLVLVGGGGLFHDYWGVDPDAFLTGRHWGVAYYAGPALLAALYRKPLMLFAVGVGPLLSGHGRKFTRLAAQTASVITVRDAGSKTALEELGIAGAKIRVTADPGFLFPPVEPHGLETALPEGFELRRPVLGVAARHWGVGVHPDFLEREIASTLDLFLKQTGGSVVLVPFQEISGERENDRATAARILEHMRLGDRAAVARQGGPAEIYGWIGNFDLVLGMRLHALIFAALAGVPAVALSYDPKVEDISGRMGIPRVNVKDIEDAVLCGELSRALERGGGREVLRAAAGELREAAVENITAALRLLDLLPAENGVRREGFDLFEAQRTEQENRELNEKLAGAAERVKSLRDENRALLHEVEEKQAISRKLAESAKRIRGLEEAKTALQASVTDLRARLHLEAEQRQAVEHTRDELAARAEQLGTELARHQAESAGRAETLTRHAEELTRRLAEADGRRALMVADLDRYAGRLESELAVYRAQRAWKGMVVLRKGYTLFGRSKARFLAWTTGLIFGRTGDLKEHDLAFPDIRGYIPDTFRHSWMVPALSGAVPAPAATPAAQPATPSAPVPDPSPVPTWPKAPDTPPPRDCFDVVILSIIDFDFRFQRPQQIAAEFARQGHRVLWISPTRFLPAASPDPYQAVPLRDNLWEIHLRSRQPDIYMGELLPGDVESMSEALDALFRDWTVSEHAVMVQLPFWRRLALSLRAQYGSQVLYDCMDDWETFENMGRFNVIEERELVRECDVLVVTGAELERKFRAQGLKPVLARNGADYAFFAKARPNDLLAGIPRPVVGYFGAIADWIDLDLVYEVAARRPKYSFVLIGQVFGRDTSKLESLPNVRLLGNKPYADIPSYLYGFDACLIPFLLNQVTKATDPVKLYEYLSLGKPVVATAMAELQQCGDLLYIGRNVEDFAVKLDRALDETDDSLVERRIAFARANTWTSRVEQIGEAARQAFPKVSILMVTYNSAPYVRPCLDSILRNTSYPAWEVILVDNASTDDTPALLKEYAEADSRIRLFPLPENLGFAGGNNYAAREARGEHLIFLNIDTMVTAGWVGRLVRHVHRDPSIGLLCPVTNFAGNEVKINVGYSQWREMESFARALAAANAGRKLEIRVAPLYCALMPRAVWERVGEMDTRYEIGMFEDDDLSLRVRRAGLGIFAAEDCFIHHFGQGSFARLPGETYNRIFEANRKRFEEKWNEVWMPHRTRPGVRPSFEEKRFEPAEFVSE
jgi:polysaccharide pyruvyl transferase CsaB